MSLWTGSESWSHGYSFLLSGLKYRETRLRINNNPAGNTSVIGLPDMRSEAIAPDPTKKNPAYAHSLSLGSFGIRIAITPRIFHIPKIIEKYGGYHKYDMLSISISIWMSCTIPLESIPKANQIVAIQ